MTSASRLEGSPWMHEDHWQVLGLSPGADADSLKRAFRRQARRWHPDLNANDPAAEERFKRVNEAYAVLSDPKRRRAWETGVDGPLDDGPSDPFATGFPSFEEYLDALFGRRQRPHSDRSAGEESPNDAPGNDSFAPEPPVSSVGEASVTTAPSATPVRASVDLETTVDLSPEQALSGARLELELPDGTLVEVWTPPRAGDGWRLRLAGVAPGGGDHFLHLRVRTPDELRIDGLKVLYRLDLHPADAALGCQVVVPTLEGPVRLRVPPASSSGRLLRLRARGQADGDERGDQLVELRIVLDREPDEAEQALYRRLRELDQERRAD